MHGYLFAAADYLIIGSSAVFAFRQGDTAERRGILWLALNMLASIVASGFGLESPTAHLVEDGLFALGLLPLAVIYVSYVVGVLTLIATGLFTLEAFYLINERPSDSLYAWINNGLWLSVPLVFLASGCMNMSRRRRVPKPLPGDPTPALG
jgi:hypothetical protein